MREETVISVRNLGKRYRLGATLSHDTLRDKLALAARSLLPRIRPFSISPSQPSSASASSPKEIWALRDVSFDVHRGEVVGIIGHNGAGKSTLLKILSQITEPTEGEVRMRGRTGSLLEVGTGMHPELSGRENIYLNGSILGMRKAEIDRRYDEIVDFAGIPDFMSTPIKRYSSGMRVRLGFAIAAHLEPEILIVDEVLAVGDMEFQKKCLGKMDDVAKSGRTVLFVSHNMAAVQMLCQTGIVLQDGATAFGGPAADAVRAYVSSLQPASRDSVVLERDDRLGLALVAAELRNDAGEIVPVMQAGMPVRLRVKMETSLPYSDFHLQISVYEAGGSKVCMFDSSLLGWSMELVPPGGVCECRLPVVPFMPGRYRITIRAHASGRDLMWLTKWWEVGVIPGDFYGSGKLPNPKWGGTVLVRHSWASDAVGSADGLPHEARHTVPTRRAGLS